jgi:hypothetical protein
MHAVMMLRARASERCTIHTDARSRGLTRSRACDTSPLPSPHHPAAPPPPNQALPGGGRGAERERAREGGARWKLRARARCGSISPPLRSSPRSSVLWRAMTMSGEPGDSCESRTALERESRGDWGDPPAHWPIDGMREDRVRRYVRRERFLSLSLSLSRFHGAFVTRDSTVASFIFVSHRGQPFFISGL